MYKEAIKRETLFSNCKCKHSIKAQQSFMSSAASSDAALKAILTPNQVIYHPQQHPHKSQALGAERCSEHPAAISSPSCTVLHDKQSLTLT